MSNVVNMRKRTHRLLSEFPAQPAGSPACDLDSLQSQSKRSIRTAIFMLDLALQLNREVAKTVRDPAARRNFDAHLSNIEELLRSTRERSLRF